MALIILHIMVDTLVSNLTWGSLFIILLLILNFKNLPFMWHVRFIRNLLVHLVFSPTDGQLTPQCLFLPVITASRAPLTECDYNLHKSNSTYSTDLDISRGKLGLLLLQKQLSVFPGPGATLVILSASSIVFKREIKPYQPYEIWTRVLSWDEKWLYLVSHFVEKGRYQPSEYWLQRDASIPQRREDEKSFLKTREERIKGVFASAISRYVFKKGRKTVTPAKMLEGCDLLPPGWGKDNIAESFTDQDQILPPNSNREVCGKRKKVEFEGITEHLEEIERRRRDNLPIAQLYSGWDAVYDTFEGDGLPALGRYADLLWR